jgi:hypothetical protein
MASWARFAGEIWDHVFSPSATRRGVSDENGKNLDAQIQNLCEVILPSLNLLPLESAPEDICRRQCAFIFIRMHTLRLLLHRHELISLDYDAHVARMCGDLALDILRRIQACDITITKPTSMRFDMISALGGVAFVLATLLVRNPAVVGLQDRYKPYTEGLDSANLLIGSCSNYFPMAQRIMDDLDEVQNIVSRILYEANRRHDGSPWPSELVPPDIVQKFPYKILDTTVDHAPIVQTHERSGMVSDTWASQPRSTARRQSVLWI